MIKDMRFFLMLLLLFVQRGLGAQITEAALKAAVDEGRCASIQQALDTTPLPNAAMLLYGGICWYENGHIDRAKTVFQALRQRQGQHQLAATFWEAKCHAVHRHDSMAVQCLQTMPPGSLGPQALSQPEFKHLMASSEVFQQMVAAVQPAFNGWTRVLGGIVVLGLSLGGVLALGRSRFSVGEGWLAVVVVAFSLILAGYVCIWTHHVYYFPYLQDTWQFLTLLVGPALYFYLKTTFQEPFFRKDVIRHFTLPMLTGLVTLPVVIINVEPSNGGRGDAFALFTSPHLLIAQLVFYALLIDRTTRNDWQIDANIKTWTTIVVWGMWAYTLAFLSYFMLVNCSFFNPTWDYAISLVMAFSILAVAYMGLVQRRVFSSQPIADFLPLQKYKTSQLTESAGASIRKNLERLMDEQQVFKENELRLDDLAAYLAINRHQLSQVINANYGVNFFEFINRYRIAYAQQLLASKTHQHYTIIQIAYEAGFNNKASFNRYFKQQMGLTPSAYRLKIHDVMGASHVADEDMGYR